MLVSSECASQTDCTMAARGYRHALKMSCFSLHLLAPLGESVEENANVVVRLLIRRPECFGPALRGEGGNGLLAAMEEAIRISANACRDRPSSPASESTKSL